MSLSNWSLEGLSVFKEFMPTRIPFNRLLGIEAMELRAPAIHGGVISALVDTRGGPAVEPERLVCVSTVVRLGGRVASVDMRVLQPHHHPARLIATGRGVYNVKRGKKPELAPSPAAPRGEHE